MEDHLDPSTWEWEYIDAEDMSRRLDAALEELFDVIVRCQSLDGVDAHRSYAELMHAYGEPELKLLLSKVLAARRHLADLLKYIRVARRKEIHRGS